MTAPTTPTFIRDGLWTRIVCPLDGTAMHVTPSGYFECNSGLHRWMRFGRSEGHPGAWKLLNTWRQHDGDS